jgi:hypothetical protein
MNNFKEDGRQLSEAEIQTGFFYFLYFFSLGETESTWHCDHCLAYCTSPIQRMMLIMIVEQSVECGLAGEAEVVAEHPLQCHFVHMTCPGLEHGPSQWEAGDKPPELKLINS